MKRLVVLMLTALFFTGFLVGLCGCQSTITCDAEIVFRYEEENGEVRLETDTVGVVRMRFHRDAVTIYDSYKYSVAVDEIASFICVYGKENGYEIPRPKDEIAGEIKLHNLLYELGYKRAHTQHADVEYTADERWYVNVLSKILA